MQILIHPIPVGTVCRMVESDDRWNEFKMESDSLRLMVVDSVLCDGRVGSGVIL
jgi:hypothetical protein